MLKQRSLASKMYLSTTVAELVTLFARISMPTSAPTSKRKLDCYQQLRASNKLPIESSQGEFAVSSHPSFHPLFRGIFNLDLSSISSAQCQIKEAIAKDAMRRNHSTHQRSGKAVGRHILPSDPQALNARNAARTQALLHLANSIKWEAKLQEKEV